MGLSSSPDRRNNIYRFHTLLELLEHFSGRLSAQQMEAVIRDSARMFSDRDGSSEQETRLQFIKKCEYTMEALMALKEPRLNEPTLNRNSEGADAR